MKDEGSAQPLTGCAGWMSTGRKKTVYCEEHSLTDSSSKILSTTIYVRATAHSHFLTTALLYSIDACNMNNALILPYPGMYLRAKYEAI